MQLDVDCSQLAHKREQIPKLSLITVYYYFTNVLTLTVLIYVEKQHFSFLLINLKYESSLWRCPLFPGGADRKPASYTNIINIYSATNELKVSPIATEKLQSEWVEFSPQGALPPPPLLVSQLQL